ncbi:MAG TPA: energy transducer TonB [Bacteroidia bacterium]|nr:energy transducer TonB [Bacteroidia bacterium]
MKKIAYIFLFIAFSSIGFGQAKSEIYTITEQMPEPKDGIQSFYQYIKQNLVYPKSAQEAKIEGRCYIKFVVEEDGSLSDITVIKGVPNCSECDQEALRVVKSYNQKWNPGKQKGKTVRVYYNIPINFKL